MLSFFDGPFMRNVFTGLVEITFLGPYFAHWKAITDFILLGEAMDNDSTDDNFKSFDEVGFYVWIAIYGAVTIFEMIIQITVAPRIFEWLESAETLRDRRSEVCQPRRSYATSVAPWSFEWGWLSV